MENIRKTWLTAVFTGLLRALSHTQAHNSILQVGAGARVTALLPELAHRVDGASVDTNLVRETGGCGAATVIGGGRGQVAKWAAQRGVDTAASAFILITALGLPKGRCPVRGAGGWGHSFALFFPAGTGKGGSAFSRVGQGWLESSFTRRHWRQVAADQVTHTLILWAAQVCTLLETSHFTRATGGSSGCGTWLCSAVNLPPTEAHTDLTGLMVWDPGL